MNAIATIRSAPGLEGYLGRLEARLEAAVSSHPGVVAEIGTETLTAGGKRLRPALTFLTTPPEDRGADRVVLAGMAVELVHMATLVHDDMLDGAMIRRGRPTAWAVHGVEAAKAGGDHLFARAFSELTKTGDAAAVAVLAEAALALARGEAMQRRQVFRPDTSVEQYLERCSLKTGKLFEAACRLGGGTPELAEFGLSLGIAFQIADDILDCTGDFDTTGKAPGVDLRDGTPTLPLILAARADPDVYEALSGVPVDDALERVAATGALEESRALALAYADRARVLLDGSPDREALEALTYVVVDREALSGMAILDHQLAGLETVRRKVEAGERLDLDDGLTLMESGDLLTLGELADLARRRRGGTDEVYFVQNLYLNQTNVCRVKCKFCAFARTQKQEDAYTLTADELVEDALRQRELTGFTEIHMVNGESPHVDFDYYVETTRKLHEAMPDVHLKLYTASEIHHMTTLSGLTHEQVLRELKVAGLGSLPGGGAEIFADRVRRLVAPGKEHPDVWFHVHDAAHRMGIPTHCTMLYGHVETYEERIDHLVRLREQQDRTGGFLAFVPLAFHPENTVFERRGFTFTPGAEDLKVIAVARLMLDNIPNVKAYWIMMGMPMAQVALHFGANDVQGTVVREQIFQAAGATAGTEQEVDQLVRFIREAGRVPVQRDTLYAPIKRWD